MRHIYNIGMLLATVFLAVVSCRKEEAAAAIETGEAATVTMDFRLDASLTKADAGGYPFGTGTLTDEHVLAWEVYTDDAEFVENGTMEVTAEGGLEELELNLMKGKKYTVVFFLYHDDEQLFDMTKGLKNIGLNYSEHSVSDDACDIFCATAEVDPALNTSFSVTLRRPTAQINIMDKVADWATQYGYNEVRISVTGAGTVLDASTGKASETGIASYKTGKIDGYQLTEGYILRSMIYVLPTEEPADITLEFIGDGSFATLVVEDVALTANTRINILADNLIATIPSENISVQQTVTPETIESMSFDSNGIYTFTGTYNENVTIRPSAGITATFDGAGATFEGQIHIRQGTGDNISDVTGVRSGSYTVKNFNAEVVSVSGMATTLNLIDNQAEAIDVDGTNVIVNVSGNTVNSQGKTYIRADNNEDNKYGIYLFIINYELTLDGNTVKGSNSHAIAINGKMDTFKEAEVDNVINSFRDNDLTVCQHQTDRAGLKIWDDATYAPASNQETEAGKALVETYKDANTFAKGEYSGAHKFDLYGTKYEQIN